MFGDGYNRLGGGSWPSGLRNKVRQVCAPGDPVSSASKEQLLYIWLTSVDRLATEMVIALTTT